MSTLYSLLFFIGICLMAYAVFGCRQYCRECSRVHDSIMSKYDTVYVHKGSIKDSSDLPAVLDPTSIISPLNPLSPLSPMNPNHW